jgi:PleD family two-component response regulator
VVTASIGVTEHTGRLDLPGAVIVADRAMYEAKHEGGDRVVVAPPRGPDADQGSNL